MKNVFCITFRQPIEKGSTNFLEVRDDLINSTHCLFADDKKMLGVLEAIVDEGVNGEGELVCAIYGLLILNTVDKALVLKLKSNAEDFPDSQLKLTCPLQGGWRDSLGDRFPGTVAPAEFTSWCSMVNNLDTNRTDEKDKKYRSFLSKALHKDRMYFMNVPELDRALSRSPNRWHKLTGCFPEFGKAVRPYGIGVETHHPEIELAVIHSNRRPTAKPHRA